LLIDLGISEPKGIDLDAIAWTRGAVVNYRPIDGCEATNIGSKRGAVISVNSRSMAARSQLTRFSSALALSIPLLRVWIGVGSRSRSAR
jgi:hypothetical protein